jgi:creatinine amidohydrolase
MLPRMIRLAELTWLQARRLARARRSVVLLPLGAVEQHGPHLPLSVDWIGSEELARRVAPHLRRRGWSPVLAPSLPYGASPLAAAWPGTVSLTPATTARLIVEVVRSLARHGFRRFVLTNYQADPGHLRAIARALATLAHGGRVHGGRVQVLVAGFAPDDGRANPMLDPRVRRLMRSSRPAGEWHAGELETAMMLAVAPSLVRRAVARRLPAAWVDWAAALARGARTFEAMNRGGRGYFGWPAAARASTGRRVMALRGRLIAAALLVDLAAWPPRRQRRGLTPSRATSR